ncbi:MAG: hypothetical protein HY894_05900 [Deltaproteobacteria bacterium]|nr:hypothetical protein [Deltaproteobacteria bacterium]
MPFIKILQELTEKTGATGAAMLDWEGEIVAAHSASDGVELDLIGAHHGIILDIIKEAALHHKDGRDERTSLSVTSVLISTGSLRLVISTLKDGYYLVVTMPRPGGLAGRTIYESKKAAAMLEAEMG